MRTTGEGKYDPKSRMKINVMKMAGGILAPADDSEAEKLVRFKTGEMYTVDIPLTRNPAFHRKMFALFNFCYEYWQGDKEFLDDAGQRDHFRKQLTIMAGYYNEYFDFDGSVRVEAKSLSYGSMSPEEFESCYQAIIQAAIKHIFPKLDNHQVYNKLIGFF